VARATKRAFKFRFYPSHAQAAELTRTFGCVRKVYNLALGARTEAWTLRQERVNYNATSAMLTEWKKTEELAFLNEVSSVPLQQTLRHLQVAYRRQFRTMLEYKAGWHGRELIAVDRWFSSSKLCSACGILAETMPLNVRAWSCPCGAVHDRDVNAARNILAEGLSVAACGAGVRPQRETFRAGRPAMKQENPRVTAGVPVLRAVKDVKCHIPSSACRPDS
jgi:putative transposase